MTPILTFWRTAPAWKRALAVLGGVALAFVAVKAVLPERVPVERTERTVTQQRTVTQTREQEEAERKLALRQQIIEQQGRELQQLKSRQANVQTRVVERIERYPVAPPATSPAPVVVVRDGEPQPMPASVAPPPIEVIVRTTETVDRSREDEQTDQTDTKRASTDTQVDDMSATRKTTDTKMRDEWKTVWDKKTREGRDPEPRGIGSPGVGVLHTAQPFAKLDLARTNVGVGPVKLGKAGLGVFLTRAWREGQVDGGPQVNFRPGKGKSGLFIMGGYQVRERMPVIGIGVEFN